MLLLTYAEPLKNTVGDIFSYDGAGDFAHGFHGGFNVGQHGIVSHAQVVRDLIFVLSGRDEIQEAKSQIPYLHYITRPEQSKNVPIEVPDEQMQHFIAVCNEMDDSAEMLSGETSEYTVGQRVRVISGAFKGIEGSLVKIEGKRSKRFVVAIEGVIAVSVSGIRPDDVESIE